MQSAWGRASQNFTHVYTHFCPSHMIANMTSTPSEGYLVSWCDSSSLTANKQRRWKTFEIGGANDSCACISTHMLGGVGVCSPRKILQIRCSKIASEATFGPKQHYSYHCYLYVFACLTLICIDVHMSCSGCCWRVQTSEFPVLSTTIS